MTINIYFRERCSGCGDIRRALKRHDIPHQGYFFPPEDSDIDALKGNISEPVLFHEKKAPDGVVGHEEILEWIEENYGE